MSVTVSDGVVLVKVLFMQLMLVLQNIFHSQTIVKVMSMPYLRHLLHSMILQSSMFATTNNNMSCQQHGNSMVKLM